MFPLINSDSKNRQSLPVAQFVKMESMYHQATELLNRSGFTGYSVEDFGKSEESYCHYQSDVWTYPQRDLLILGSGGFGISESVQYRKEKNRTRYIERVQQGEFPLDRFQPISEKRAEKVRPLMGLHYNSVTHTQFPLYPLFRTTGILKREGNRYTLTPRGRFATSLLWAKVMLQRMVN